MMSEQDVVVVQAAPTDPSQAVTFSQEAVATHILASDETTEPEAAVAEVSSTSSIPRKNPKTKNKPKRSVSPSPSTGPADMASLPLLICSIGNPGAAYANTLHSAGHTVVQAMAALLQTSAFSKDRSYGNGAITRSYSPEIPWTLWQSPTYMNESGKGVSAAYRTWNREIVGNIGRLVVVHDELEKPLGSVTIRDKEGLSAKGHNGIKSCLSSLGPVKFVRIGIGIGRPASRDSNDVARYVLKKMSPAEKIRIEAAAEDVLNKLMALRG